MSSSQDQREKAGFSKSGPQSKMGETDPELKKSVIRLSQALANYGLVSALDITAGNISLVDEGRVGATRAGAILTRLKYSDVITWPSLDEPPVGVTSEIRMHQMIYSRMESARCVIHTHSRFATAAGVKYAQAGYSSLPLVHYYQARLGAERIPIVPYYHPGTEELAEVVGRMVNVDAVSCLLLSAHGALTWGSSAVEALKIAMVLEWVSRLLIDVQDVEPIGLIEPDQLESLQLLWR